MSEICPFRGCCAGRDCALYDPDQQMCSFRLLPLVIMGARNEIGGAIDDLKESLAADLDHIARS